MLASCGRLPSSHADDEHVAEFQALGAVQAHQPHLRCRARRGRRGYSSASCAASSPAPPPFGAVEPVGEFVEVVAARAGSWPRPCTARAASASRPDCSLQLAHQFGRRQRARVDRAGGAMMSAKLVQRRPPRAACSCLSRPIDSAARDSGSCACCASSASFASVVRADLALGRLHRAQEGRVVVGIGEQPQPGQRVLDLAAIEERGAAGQVVGNAQQLQRLFQRAATGGCRGTGWRTRSTATPCAWLEVLDLGGDALGLVLVVAGIPRRGRARRRRAGSTAVFGCACGLFAISALAARRMRPEQR